MIIRDFIEQDNIKIFDEDIKENHADYNAVGLDNLYAQEEKHFWFIARKEFILRSIKQHIKKSTKIIEIGAGTGNVSRYLQNNGYKNISVGEIHLNGLKYAQGYGISECYQFDLLNSPFENEFGAVCLFDVLEHIKQDGLALKNVHQSLTKDGLVVLTVPSHMWLWSRDDAVAGHKTRYTKKLLIKKLMDNNFKILTAKYFFMSIVPLLLLRTILKRDYSSQVRHEEHEDGIVINSMINRILLFVSRIENRINLFLPNLFGGSLLIIAKKK